MRSDSKAISSSVLKTVTFAWIGYIVLAAFVLWSISDAIIFLIACLFLYNAACGLLGYSLASTVFRKGSTPFLWGYGGFVIGFVSEITVPLILTRFWA